MKLKNKILPFLIFFVLTSSFGCNQESEQVINAFYALDISLIRARNITKIEIDKLEEKFDDYNKSGIRTSEMQRRMGIAIVIVEKAKKLSDEIELKLKDYRDNIILRSGDIDHDTKRIKHESNKYVVEEIMITNGNGEKMFQKLFKFKKEMASLIDNLPNDMKLISQNRTFAEFLPILKDSITSSSKFKDREHEIFKNLPDIAAVAVIDKYINEIKFCNLTVLAELEACTWGDVKVHPIITNP